MDEHVRKNIKPKPTGEPLTEENPKTTKAEEGSGSQDTATQPEATQQESEGNGNPKNPTGSDVEMQQVATGINRLKLTRPKLSGAQKRKRAIQAAIAAGETVRPRKKRSNRRSKEQEADPSTSQQKTSKRARSEGSTPSSTKSQPSKLQKSNSGIPLKVKPSTSSNQDTTGATFSQALTATKMAVVLENYPEERLSEEQSKTLQMAIMGEIWKCKPPTAPQFKNSYADKGAVYFTCGNEKSKTWLMETVPKLNVWEGAVLRTGVAKDIVKTTKVVVWVPTEFVGSTEVGKVFQLLETQNEGITTKDWRVVSTLTRNP